MRTAFGGRAVLAALGGLLVVGGAVWVWSAGRDVAARADLRGANVLVVTIDTLRADRLGSYGNRAGLTPTLDALSAQGARFARAWSHAPVTLPAHASIFTGRLPPHHGVRNNGSFRLGPEPATLAACLQQAGYRTGAFVGAFVLDTRFGLSRGFDEYDDRYDAEPAPGVFHFTERSADRVLRAATAWITKPPSGDVRPWFAWVHLFDPHAPYRAPAAYARDRTPYDAEVAWTDAALGSALDELRRAGADGTYGRRCDCRSRRVARRPRRNHAWIVCLRCDAQGPVDRFRAGSWSTSRLNARAARGYPAHDSRSARDHDHRPTSTDASLRAGDPSRNAATEGRPVYFEALDANLTRGWAPLRGVVDGQWKYIDCRSRSSMTSMPILIERTNVVDSRAGACRASSRPGSAHGRRHRSLRAVAWTRRRRRSCGRSDTSRARAPRARRITPADDPKRLVASSEAFNAALEDFSSGRSEAALRKVLYGPRRSPRLPGGASERRYGAHRNGRATAAVAPSARRATTRHGAAAWLTKMGQALAASGKVREAREVLASAVAATAGDQEPLNELGVVLLRLGQVDEARRAFERLLDADPTAAGTWYNVGSAGDGRTPSGRCRCRVSPRRRP